MLGFLFTEKQLRKVIREELERFMETPREPPNSYSIKAETGAEIIMPNLVREAFDEGKITSVKDII